MQLPELARVASIEERTGTEKASLRNCLEAMQWGGWIISKGWASSTDGEGWRRFEGHGQLSGREIEKPTDPPSRRRSFWSRAHGCPRSTGWLRLPMVLLAWLLSVVAAQGQESTKANLPTLTRVEQIREMTIEEAGRGYPVRIRGVVTYYNWDEGDLFIQDSTAGIWVSPGQTKLALHHGEFVQVEGFSGVGDLAPVIEHAHFQSLGEAPMPDPRRPTSDELASGRQDSQWIELQGVVRSVAEREGGLVLNLSSGAFECSVFVLKYPSLPTDIVDGQVRVRGVFGGLYDPSSIRFIGFHVLTPSWADVKVLERPAQRLSSVPARPLRLFLRLTPEGAFTHRVHVQGVVTFQQLGQSLCIRDPEGALLVNTTQPTPLKVGDLIDATGYPAIGDYTVVMRDAIFQRVGTGPAPQPVAVSPEKLQAGHHNADLVRLSARLLNCTTRPGEEVLELQADGVAFRAVLNTRTSSSPTGSLRAGSLLQLTGVSIVEADKNHQAKGFEILLRSPADVVVLELPSWWTARRVSWLLIILAGILFWILFWVAVLRRRVEERAETIRATLESTVDGILVVDSVGKIVAYNRKFPEMWRIPESVLASRDANVARSFVLSQLKDPDAFLTRVRQAHTDHNAQTDDVIEFKDGRVFELHSEPQRLTGRSVGRVWGFRDTTERKRAEERLRESEQFNREVIANAQEGVTVYDREFRYQVWNRFMEELTGVPASEALGKHAFDLFPHLREQKLDLLIRRALAGEVVHAPDTPFRVPTTGKTGWVSAVYSPHFGARGEIIGVIGTIRDITERKRAEELVQEGRKELQTIIDSVPALVFYKDKTNRLVRVNRAFSEAMGMPKKEMENRTCSELWPETGEGYWSDDREVIESGRPKRNIVETVKTAQGTRWLQTDKIPHLDEGGKVVGIIGFAVDITDRKRAEAALIEERHLLYTLMDNVPDTIYFKDRGSRFTRINKALAKAFGLKDAAQAVGKIDFDFFTEEHARQAYADEQEVIRTGRPVLAKEEKETWPDGRETWASTTKMPLRDAQGQIVGTFGISRDITERKGAERALQERTAYLNTLIENNPLAIVTVDVQGRIQMCNPAFERLFLYRRDEIEGAKLDELVAPPEFMSEAMEYTKQSLSGIGVHAAGRRRRKDGSLMDVEIFGVPLVMQGEIVGEFALYQDITERKRAEEARAYLASIVDSSDDAIIGKGPEGVIRSWNRGAERLYGYAAPEVLGQSVLLLVPPERQEELAGLLDRIRQGESIEHHETTRVTKGGRHIDVSVTISPVKNAGGEVVGASAIARDITARKRAEEALLLSEEKFAKAFRSSPNAMAISTLEDGLFLEVNDSFLRRFGRQREDVVGRTAHELGVWVNPDDRVGVIDELRKSGRVNGREILLRSCSGQTWVGLYPAEAIEVRGVHCQLTAVEDITKRKRAEEALRDANRALTAISAVNEAVLHKTEEPLLLQEVCRCIVEHAGYRMAWVGFLNDDEPKRIYPVAEAGFEQGYLQSIDVRCDDSERGRGPTGTAARTQKPAIVRNTTTDAGFAPWRAEAIARGYASVIGLPLLTGENLLGVLTIYSAQPDAFDEQEVRLLSELAGDLAFGIQALRTRAEQARAEEALIEERHLLHTLMDNVPDTIYFKDRGSRFTRINKALAKAFGLKDAAQAVGKIDFDFFTEEHARQAYVDEQEIIRTGQPVLGKEEKETWPDGRETWASTTKMPLRDAHGNIIGTFGISRDITERKRAEQALLLSEEKFAKAFRSSPNAMAISTLEDGRFLEVNDSYLRWSGRQREDVVGRTALELGAWVNPDDRVGVIDELRKSGRVDGREILLQSRSGQIGVCLFSAETIEVRGVPCLLTVAENITERKRAEEALQESERQLAQAMDRALLAHWELNTATRIFTFNDRFYALYGTTAEREGGYQMSAETYAREFFFPEDMHIVADEIAKGLAATDPDAAWTVEHRIRRRDGEIRHIVVRISVIKNSEGLTIKARGVNQDITERKRAEEALRESEERFRRFIENVPLGVCRTTPDGRVLMANPTLVRMLGYDSWQELASRNLEDEALEAGYPRSAFREQIEREGEVGGFEAAWKRRDGSVIFVREAARAFRADDGRVLYYDCIVEDVTERRRLGEQLRQSQKMEAIGCLAGGVAHDFNNLLTVVTGYSDLLLKRPPATCAGMRAPLEEIKKAAERAASLTRQLLTFSRKQMLQPQILDLNSLLTNVDEMLRRMIGEDIELVTHLHSGLGRVKADPGQIEQVIMNLAVNARDAMPQGGQLTLEAANVELDSSYGSSHESVLPGHYVMIAMSDTGIGMDAETQAHIFEPFFTTKEVGKGTGLGLATVYGIVKQSGGSIQVYSEPGKGTTFKVYLPRIDEADEVIASTNVPVDELSRGSETILLAEDEEAVRSLVRGVLESTGYQVLETKGANEALEIGERHRKHIHLLLTDVVMPQMSGAELVKHLAPLHPETKVLYMSGYTDHAVVRHGLLDSSTAFLQKPFTPDALALKVREVLDGAARQGT